MRLVSKKISSTVPPASLTEVFSKLSNPSILGGNDADCPANRFSVWSANPTEIFEFKTGEQNVFEKLKTVLEKYRIDSPAEIPEGMFPCGWIGYFSYDLGRHIEKVPDTSADDLSLPLIRLCFYDRAICYDHTQKTWWLIALEKQGTNDAQQKIQKLQDTLCQAARVTPDKIPPGDLHAVDVSGIKSNMTKDFYMDAIAKTRKYIYDGEVYQINFSQRFQCDYDRPPVALYHWQNKYNPSPYAAFLGAPDHAIVSASPEMFIAIADDAISTKPIKGTRRRFTGIAGQDRINKINFTELVESEKDQAELNMIIDLERNDLTRICRYGTIKVTQPRTIERYPTVFHAVATVEGKLHSRYDYCDILRAIFPGGSITGAPKIRSMEIIDQLEPTRRSVYTGSIGYIGVDGNVCLNIAIRTVIIRDGQAFVQTGGGIVADSDPRSEWEETITKARALLAGIAAVQGDTKTKTEKVKQ